jgi:hypothetical protein
VVHQVYRVHQVQFLSFLNIQKSLFSLSRSIQGRDGYSNIKSAFFVALNNTYSLQTDSSIIVWDDILLNKNNHLNSQSGIYYAPTNGLYEFSLTVCVPANQIVCLNNYLFCSIDLNILGIGIFM